MIVISLSGDTYFQFPWSIPRNGISGYISLYKKLQAVFQSGTIILHPPTVIFDNYSFYYQSLISAFLVDGYW